jgi:hydrogenase expression/formation protein HypD
VLNRYKRSVSIGGNLHALQLVEEVYQICDRAWRGLGIVPQGGLALRESWSQFDALRRFSPAALPVIDSAECRSGEVLTGQVKPVQCEHFANRCTPEHPLGAPMVSAEGACAAYYRYASPRTAALKS